MEWSWCQLIHTQAWTPVSMDLFEKDTLERKKKQKTKQANKKQKEEQKRMMVTISMQLFLLECLFSFIKGNKQLEPATYFVNYFKDVLVCFLLL